MNDDDIDTFDILDSRDNRFIRYETWDFKRLFHCPENPYSTESG